MRFKDLDESLIEGCMAVDLPLVGSGCAEGTRTGDSVSFAVAGDASKITFVGLRGPSGLNGTYTVSSPGRSEQNGVFQLHKISSEGLSPGFDLSTCPDDALILTAEAEKGNPDAEIALAGLYMNGSGVPKDMTKACSLFEKAANQGYAYAQALLGMAYMTGDGVTKNLGQAYFWLYVASKGISPDLKSAVEAGRDKVGTQLSFEDAQSLQEERG